MWSDEFNGTSVDTSKWVKASMWGGNLSSNWGNFSYDDAANLSVGNGNLTITTRNTSGGPTGLWTGGVVYQQFSSAFTYGFTEARIKLPKGAGLFPAFWMCHLNGQPNWNEFDINEFLGGDPTTIYQSFFYGPYPGTNTMLRDTPKSVDWTTDYHLFQMKWEPGRVTYYMDNVEMGSWTAGVPSQPMFIILNSDVGGPGTWGGGPNSATPTINQLLIDYVRVYQQ